MQLVTSLIATLAAIAAALYASQLAQAQVRSISSCSQIQTSQASFLHQATGGVYFCTDTSFEGDCQYLHVQAGVCYNLNPPFNDSISSAGPDAGWLCVFYV